MEIVPRSPDSDREDWVPVHPAVMSAPELSRHMMSQVELIHALFYRLLRFRREHHARFTFVATSLFLFIAAIGMRYSGTFILYIFLMALALTPGFYLYVLPEPIKCQLNGVFNSLLHAERHSRTRRLSPRAQLRASSPLAATSVINTITPTKNNDIAAKNRIFQEISKAFMNNDVFKNSTSNMWTKSIEDQEEQLEDTVNEFVNEPLIENLLSSELIDVEEQKKKNDDFVKGLDFAYFKFDSPVLSRSPSIADSEDFELVSKDDCESI